MNNSNTLHVYGQRMWHDDVFICGDKIALTSLADMIHQALDNPGQCSKRSVFVNDGEGFNIRVTCKNDTEMDQMLVPYTDEIARDKQHIGHDISFHPGCEGGCP